MQKVRLLDLNAFSDNRGCNAVLYDKSLEDQLGFHLRQINQGYSLKAGTLRGLHFQSPPYDQAKLVQVLCGSIYNVAVDIRPDSPLFGTYYAQLLSFEKQKICYIPRGFAHGYLTLEDHTLVQWCVDNDFCRDAAYSLKFNDPDIVGEDGIHRIPWPWDLSQIILSDKDKAGLSLDNIRTFSFQLSNSSLCLSLPNKAK